MRRPAIAIVPAALVLALAACGDAGGSIEPLVNLATATTADEAASPDASVAPSETANESEDPSAAATETPATSEPTTEAATAKPLPVEITKRTNPVDPGDDATVTVKTGKGAKCSIYVEYESGPSEAKGLRDKRATSKGRVAWTWMVGSSTNPQRVPITVDCRLNGRSGTDSTAIRVR